MKTDDEIRAELLNFNPSASKAEQMAFLVGYVSGHRDKQEEENEKLREKIKKIEANND